MPWGRRLAPFVCAAAVLFPACSRELRVRVGQEIQMGQYTLRVSSVDAYTRAHQGVPFEVEIRVQCGGGNRFERLDFAQAVSKKAKIYFTTAQGWRERAWLLERGDDYREFAIQVHPPLKSSGMTLRIGNPFAGRGAPDNILVDLGR